MLLRSFIIIFDVHILRIYKCIHKNFSWHHMIWHMTNYEFSSPISIKNVQTINTGAGCFLLHSLGFFLSYYTGIFSNYCSFLGHFYLPPIFRSTLLDSSLCILFFFGVSFLYLTNCSFSSSPPWFLPFSLSRWCLQKAQDQEIKR